MKLTKRQRVSAYMFAIGQEDKMLNHGICRLLDMWLTDETGIVTPSLLRTVNFFDEFELFKPNHFVQSFDKWFDNAEERRMCLELCIAMCE